MKVLVVVDYQNDFVYGSLGFEGAEKLDKGIAAKVRSGNYDKIVATYDTHYPTTYMESREGKALPVEHCFEGTIGWENYGETAEALNEVDTPVLKRNKETFASHPRAMLTLETALGDEPVESVEFVGLVTNMCVLSQVVCFQGLYPNAQMIVDASLVNSFNKDLHEKTLDVLEGMQVQVINRNK